VPSPHDLRPSDEGIVLAAVDLGSNSFHMVVGRDLGGDLRLIDRIREPVRLAGGLDEDGNLDAASVERALGCLERFGERLRALPTHHVRAVGTHTLRRLKTPRDFLSRARRTLGFPIEILPGAEEARLIYQGVTAQLEQDEGRRLVVDIGGGSTECIVGENREPLIVDSLRMGCVSWSQRFFGGGELKKKAFKKATLAARLELEMIQEPTKEAGWTECVGSSGTIRAVQRIAAEAGWIERKLTLDAVRRLEEELIARKKLSELELPGLDPVRAPVLAGGLAVLRAVFDSLGIEEMRVTRAALREGILHDLWGRMHHEDVRERTVRALAARYRVDAEQAARVETTALEVFDQVRDAWELDPDLDRRRLSWVARLHELGLAVSWSGYHKHGAYLLEHGDLPGFAFEEQRLLAALVLSHRRRLRADAFDDLPPFTRRPALPLAVLLRLAFRLHRGRTASALPPLRVEAAPSRLTLTFPPGWLDARPLTRADLEGEAALLARGGVELVLEPAGESLP
jgi:exopolyphosphatase/guanosine-5'-triphosphate,3'-diphosphate pyrophosphatase